MALNTPCFDEKWVNVTQEANVKYLGLEKPMDEFFTEEADAKIFYHIKDALACVFNRLGVLLVDSDVV